MVFIRREIRSLGPGWNPTMLWYAKGVRALQARPFTDKTSWLFFAAMHGFQSTVWQTFGAITATTPLPPAAVRSRFWDQCQHQSWYFLPWHRGYLFAFEQIMRAAIVGLGGPADWALPYWNYSNPAIANARQLPPVFAASTLPDGTANPLLVSRRYGRGTVPIVLSNANVALTAMADPQFTGGASDIPPGFGGPVTTFHHGPESVTTNGGLESQPHNVIHGAIGGSRPGADPNQWQSAGLMSMPITAGLDPIFWLHHCNIDRLWTQWLLMRGHGNTLDPRWARGPADRGFVMPLANGTEWAFNSIDVIRTTKAPLSYRYDDQPVTSAGLVDLDEGVEIGDEAFQEAAMTAPPASPELIGASSGRIEVSGDGQAALAIDADGGERVMRSMAAAASLTEGAAPSDRVYLKLEGIKGTGDATIYHVYVDLPPDAIPAQHPERLAGTVSLFGVSAASDPDGPNAGNGVNQVLDITDIVSGLGLRGDSLNNLAVRFVPDSAQDARATFSVDRIGVFRLGAD